MEGKQHRLEINGTEYVFEAGPRPCPQPDRHLSQDQLEALELFISCHPDFFYLFDRDHRFTFVSPSLLALWGKTLEEAVGKTFAELGYPPELCELHRKQLELAFEGSTVRGENSYSDSDGQEGYFEYIFVPLGEEEGEIRFVGGITRDISARKRAEAEKERLMYTVSHDLRTPLAAIVSGVEVFSLTDDPVKRKNFRALILRNARRVEAMVRNILDSSRLGRGGRVEFEPDASDLVQVVKSSVADLDAIHKGRIRFDCGVSGIEGAWDSNAIWRIIENLVTNAAKYGAHDKPVTVSLSAASGTAWLKVHNSGGHIAEEKRKKLFDLFTRASDEEGTASGWGIGLSVVAALVQRMQGKVHIKSGRNEGTTFTVELPIPNQTREQ